MKITDKMIRNIVCHTQEGAYSVFERLREMGYTSTIDMVFRNGNQYSVHLIQVKTDNMTMSLSSFNYYKLFKIKNTISATDFLSGEHDETFNKKQVHLHGD